MSTTPRGRTLPRSERHSVSRTLAALQFAKRLAANRGRVSPTDIAILRRAGFTDHEVSEISSRVIASE
jgi:hypothetical protein